MTSQVSLTVNKKAGARSPWVHSFWEAVREGSVVAGLAFLVYLCMFGGTFLKMVTDAASQHATPASLAQYYLFSPLLSYFMPVVLLIAAMIQGFLMFRFLFQRGATNAWMSLGLKRSELFWSRFVAGAAEILLPILASMAVILVANLAYYPHAGLVFSRWLGITAGLCVQVFALYAIVSAVCAVSGTAVEALSYSFVAASLPSAVLVSMNALMLKFLFGFGVGEPQYSSLSLPTQLAADYSSFNPLLFLYRFISRYASDSGNITTQVSALPILGWLIAGILLAVLAHRFFRQRRIEITGVMGSNRVLGLGAVFVVALLAFSIPCMVTVNLGGGKSLSVDVLLLISAFAASAVFFLMAFPLRLIGRPRWKGLLALPAGLAAMFLIVGVLATGGLGYSAWTPDANDVNSVSATYNGLPAYVPIGGWGSNGGLMASISYSSSVNLTDPGDVAVIVNLQKAYVKAGRLAANLIASNPRDIVYNIKLELTYHMKDGSTVKRLYRQTDYALLMQSLAIDGLEGTRKSFGDFVGKPIAAGQIQYNDVYQTGDIYLSSRLLDCTVKLALDDAKRQELLACLGTDVSNQSVEDRYFTTSPEACVLEFNRDNSMDDYGRPQWGVNRIYVTQAFTKTIAFLNENNLLSQLPAEREVESLDVQDYHRYIEDNDYMADVNNFPVFMNNDGSQNMLKDEKGLLHVTDAGQITSLLQSGRAQCLNADGGYLLYIHYKGTNMVTSLFLPMKDAPEFVKQGVK